MIIFLILQIQLHRMSNIGPPANLIDFIERYPIAQTRKQFQILEQSFPTHRAVKGDGNCFYRAFAFLYLSNTPITDFTSIFPSTEWICKQKTSTVTSNQDFKDQLQKCWEKCIEPLSKIEEHSEKEKKLESLFNEEGNFDDLIVGYMRSVNYWHLKNNYQKYSPFLSEGTTLQNELVRISTFGAESEGTEIFTLAEFFQVRMTIFYVDHHSFQPVEFNEQYQNKKFYLFFRPGHYDIVYPYRLGNAVTPGKSTSALRLLMNKFKSDGNQNDDSQFSALSEQAYEFEKYPIDNQNYGKIVTNLMTMGIFCSSLYALFHSFT